MLDTKIEFALMKIISEMVKCPAGSFMMGSPKDELGRNIYGHGRDFETQHKVAITQPFWIGKFLITEELYETIMEEVSVNRKDNRRINSPASQVTYQEAKTFCKKLNKLIKQVNIPNGINPKDYHFDLPTEAQWEYACRAGTTRAFNSNDNLSNEEDFLEEIAWYSESMLTPDIVSLIRRGNMNYYENNSFPKVYKDIKDEDWIQYRNLAKPVGQLLSNDWNIFDMHGNVYEWVRDTFKRKGEDTSIRNDDGYTALQCAAFYNSNIDILNILLEYSKKDDYFSCEFDDFSESALCLALSQNENIEVIKRLIDYDPTQNKDNDYFSKLLIEVGLRGYKVFPCFKEIVKLLISKGADINKIIFDSGRKEYKYVLGEAIKYNDFEAVKCLLDLGADPNLIVRNRQNKVTAFPLYDCVNSRNNSDKNKILKLLLARNANINQKSLISKKIMGCLRLRLYATTVKTAFFHYYFS